jgi:GNAT superfamily N-acetyltransferase
VSGSGFRVAQIRSAEDPAFDVAWGALHDEFAPRGEIERRDVVVRWLANPGGYGAAGLRVTYHLVAVHDADGRLAAVRDHHVIVDRDRAVVTVYLAHALVTPEFRRRGLARELRRLARLHGEYAAETAGIDSPEMILAAEMEPMEPDRAETVTRLIAYGRDGFAAIEPARILYRQPDFRDPQTIDGDARSIPLLAVVRRIGHEGAPAIGRDLAESYVRHLYAVFATHCRASDLAPLAARSYAALNASGPLVPLVPLPISSDDAPALESLQAARVVPLHALN